MDIQEMLAVRRGHVSVIKLFVQRALQTGELVQAAKLIEQYKEECPADLDVSAMETMFDLYSGNVDAALQHALEGVRKYPCNGDLQYNLGCVYEQKEEWFLAWMSYGRALTLYEYCKLKQKIEKLGLKQRMYLCSIKHETGTDSRQHAGYEYWVGKKWGLNERAFRSPEQILGQYYWESVYKKKYAGIYWDHVLTRDYDNNRDLLHIKGEFIKVTEGNEFYVEDGSSDVLLPVASENDNTITSNIK